MCGNPSLCFSVLDNRLLLRITVGGHCGSLGKHKNHRKVLEYARHAQREREGEREGLEREDRERGQRGRALRERRERDRIEKEHREREH